MIDNAFARPVLRSMIGSVSDTYHSYGIAQSIVKSRLAGALRNFSGRGDPKAPIKKTPAVLLGVYSRRALGHFPSLFSGTRYSRASKAALPTQSRPAFSHSASSFLLVLSYIWASYFFSLPSPIPFLSLNCAVLCHCITQLGFTVCCRSHGRLTAPSQRRKTFWHPPVAAL